MVLREHATRILPDVDPDRFAASCPTRRFGRALHWYPVTDSTNDRAIAAIRAGTVATGDVFVAERQTRGRGTGERSWYSNHGEGLWYSLVVHEPVAVAPLSFLPGIALVDVLRRDYGVDAHLKWPNDVLVDDRKIAGFLVESQQAQDGRLAWVVGCGIDVNQRDFEPQIRDIAVSLLLCTGRAHAIDELLRRHLVAMERLYDSGVDLVAAWPSRARMIGRWMSARVRDRESHVYVHGLTPEGHLRVEHEDGRRETWVSHTDLSLRFAQRFEPDYGIGGVDSGQLGPAR